MIAPLLFYLCIAFQLRTGRLTLPLIHLAALFIDKELNRQIAIVNKGGCAS
jgi:hypothetical protein